MSKGEETKKLSEKWPDCDCQDEYNLTLHDYLCDILEAKGFNEQDVCSASMGIWGAIALMRKDLDSVNTKNEILSQFVKSQKEEYERVSKMLHEISNELYELKQGKSDERGKDE